MFSCNQDRAWQASERANHRTGMLRQCGRARFASFRIFGDRTRYATAGDRLRRRRARRPAAPRRSRATVERAALAPACRPLSRSAGAVRLAPLPSEPAQGTRADVRARDTWERLGAASSPEGREIDDFSDIFDVRNWDDNQPVADRRPDRAAAAGLPSDRVLRHADHRSVRCDVRLQRRHRVLRRVGRTGARRRRRSCARRRGRTPPTARRSCTCPAPRRARAATKAGVRELLLDPHSALDVPRGRHQRGEGRVRRPVHAVVCERDVRRRRITEVSSLHR